MKLKRQIRRKIRRQLGSCWDKIMIKFMRMQYMKMNAVTEDYWRETFHKQIELS